VAESISDSTMRTHTDGTIIDKNLSLAALKTVRFMDFFHSPVIYRGHDGLPEP